MGFPREKVKARWVAPSKAGAEQVSIEERFPDRSKAATVGATDFGCERVSITDCVDEADAGSESGKQESMNSSSEEEEVFHGMN